MFFLIVGTAATKKCLTRWQFITILSSCASLSRPDSRRPLALQGFSGCMARGFPIQTPCDFSVCDYNKNHIFENLSITITKQKTSIRATTASISRSILKMS